MKRVVSLIFLGLATVGLGVHALSFGPDTIFLQADNQATCVAIGGNFTQRYEETYCTATPESLLSETEQTKIHTAGERLISLIMHNRNMYDEVLAALEGYKAIFMDTNDMKKVAIAMLLIQDIQSSITMIPETCTVWYDGCNTCHVGENGELACTRMACIIQEDAMCKVHEKTIIIADHTESCTGEGVQSCLLVSETEAGDRTYFYDSIIGFTYMPGVEWTLSIRETHLDPALVPADASSIEWELLEVLSIHADMPENCTTWFDGCNTCSVKENGLMMCTLMACMGEPMMPYCMDEGIDSTKATDYNSSRSNKNGNN